MKDTLSNLIALQNIDDQLAHIDAKKGSLPQKVEELENSAEDITAKLAESETKTFTLTPEQAYGERRDDLEQTFMRSELPDGFDPQVGQVLALRNPQGGQIPATVKLADAEKITVDLNHPLAGKTLTFDIEVVKINEESSQPSCSPSACGSCGSTCS